MTNPTTLETIAKDIKNHRVILFMKGSKLMPVCGFSAQVVNILNKHSVPYETRNVLTDDSLRSNIKTFSDWPTIPQLYIDETFIGGCDIICQLDEAGDLAPLLKGASV
ncbi:monothiol glutaredoxin, Grx4 family [Candidatus Aerophobetes bacterium]|uniref:Glutaredoxin n=1 Tax=Aerophobetes bacterium TaxID=2030807 RepID=A0A2A4X6Y7_UNCAE|nr:MAG: monothiol glutaredoxin, Grx4 family [Candidatus Aerophobetes bacterium]